MNHLEKRFDAKKELAPMDPEQRAWTRRAWCYFDDDGDLGDGPEATLNRAAYGDATQSGAEEADFRMFADSDRDRKLLRLMAKGRTACLSLAMLPDDRDFELLAYVQMPEPIGTPPKRTRSTALSGSEVLTLFETASFLIWKYGKCFNFHITVTPALMGIPNQQFHRLMAAWNKSVSNFLKVSHEPRRQRRSRRILSMSPQPHLWMFVYEFGRDHGLHAHELCVIPRELWPDFKDHTRRWWENAAGREIPREALHMEPSYALGSKQATDQFHRVRYLAKAMQRTATIIVNNRELTVEGVFRPRYDHAAQISQSDKYMVAVTRFLSLPCTMTVMGIMIGYLRIEWIRVKILGLGGSLTNTIDEKKMKRIKKF